MIIINENNYPVIIMIFDRFFELEYKTFIKNLEYYEKKNKNEDFFLKLYIDLYNLHDYSYQHLNKLIQYLNENDFKTFDSSKIFFNKKNTSYIMKAMAYVNNMNQNDFRMEIIDLEEPKKW